MSKHLVFVYGTLKSDQRAAYMLEDATFVAHAVTVDRYCMRGGTGFPVVLPGDDGHVVGEVWRVDDDTFASLDRMESNGHMYQRQQVSVCDDSGSYAEVFKAWMYIGMGGVRRWRGFAPLKADADGCFCWKSEDREYA